MHVRRTRPPVLAGLGDIAHELSSRSRCGIRDKTHLGCKCCLACAQKSPHGSVIRPSNGQTPHESFSWPAPFREYQSPGVRRATKQTCQFERLAPFRTRRHPPRELQSIGRAGIPIKPVDQVLRRFFTHRSVELLLSGPVGVLKQQDSGSSDVYSQFRSFRLSQRLTAT